MKNQFEVQGEVTSICLKRRDKTVLKTLISTSDLEKVNEFPNTWYAAWDKGTKSFYVFGNLLKVNGQKGTVLLHRWILDARPGLFTDHINHDTLNNTRNNLRLITNAENQQNRKGAQVNSSSGVRGVSWHKEDKKFRASIMLNGKYILLGSSETIEEAEKIAIEGRKQYMPFSEEITKHA